MRIVGLTGGIACGKSTVVAILKKQGIPVIDCDQISRDIFEVGHPAYLAVVREFGTAVVNQDDMTINRAALGDIVFASDDQRRKLTKITGPAISKEIARQVFQYWLYATPVVVIDAPTLYETGALAKLCSMVVVIAADEEKQIERMKARNEYTQEQAEARIAAQIPVAEKVKRADLVIWNNSDDIGEINTKAMQLSKTLKKKYLGLSLLNSAPGIGLIGLCFIALHRMASSYVK